MFLEQKYWSSKNFRFSGVWENRNRIQILNTLKETKYVTYLDSCRSVLHITLETLGIKEALVFCPSCRRTSPESIPPSETAAPSLYGNFQEEMAAGLDPPPGQHC